MAVSVDLAFGARGAHRIMFAALTGADERAGADAGAMLARLALEEDGAVSGDALRELPVGDRDRALAALYGALYGDDIIADAVCIACAARYEIRFDLAELAASRRPDGSASGEPPAIALGRSKVRLPRWSDITGSPATLLARLTLSGPVPAAEPAARAIEAADPSLELDLAATCPECRAAQMVPFSMTAFIEAALRRDRAFLVREVHLLASTYRWSHAEILSLTRAERQSYARLLIGERETAQPLRRVS
ncbi:hypothetical protein [Sphingomonas sp.]|uniref:hypothetical protein n=1 Tax=Sphingomonas sp. TaxID=28214 RepID=UPI003D6D9DCD